MLEEPAVLESGLTLLFLIALTIEVFLPKFPWRMKYYPRWKNPS
jgi:hypothetical protein